MTFLLILFISSDICPQVPLGQNEPESRMVMDFFVNLWEISPAFGAFTATKMEQLILCRALSGQQNSQWKAIPRDSIMWRLLSICLNGAYTACCTGIVWQLRLFQWIVHILPRCHHLFHLTNRNAGRHCSQFQLGHIPCPAQCKPSVCSLAENGDTNQEKIPLLMLHTLWEDWEDFRW